MDNDTCVHSSDSTCNPNLDPAHYRNNDIFSMEPVQLAQQCFSKEAFRGAMTFAVLKYLYRFEDKNGAEDLDKAKNFIDFMKADFLGKDVLYFLNNPESKE